MVSNSSIDNDRLLEAAEKYWHAGKNQEAAQLLGEFLTRIPKHAHANYMMAMLVLTTKNFAVAEKFLSTAISQNTPDIYIYQKTLGDMYRDSGTFDKAISAYIDAVKLKPDYLEALTNLGTVSLIVGKIDDAQNYYNQVLTIDPKHAISLYNLGYIHESQLKIEEAKDYYVRAINANPNFAEAYNNLGTILKNSGNLTQAEENYIKAISLKANYADAHFNLGITLRKMKSFQRALQEFLTADSIRPSPEISVNIGQIFMIQGQPDKAAEYFKQALSSRPDYIDAISNLASAYSKMGMIEKSYKLWKNILSADPHHAYAFNGIANCLKIFGQVDQAIIEFKNAIKCAPHIPSFYSNLLLTMIYSPSIQPEEITETAKEFGSNVADPLFVRRVFDRNTHPHKKLRIGYVSPDFIQHAVNYFFEGLLNYHDRGQFEIYAYSNVQDEDDVTRRLKGKFDYWRDIKTVDGDVAANIIAADQIDILVDLAGHTANNRLLIFARKPAPIQVTWLGYPATTGMKAIDYRITDIHAEPEGMTEHLSVETLWRLPDIFCCYGSQDKVPAVIDHPPLEDNGYITFGCFNNFAKVTDQVLDTWRQIMEQVANSRLLLEISGADSPNFKSEIEERLERLGIPFDRIIVQPRKRENQFVLYNKIDMALDPFPCAGGTTSMDTLWMGVPFITLAGKSFAARMGVTILTNVELPELIAGTTGEYIAKAVALANDPDRLRAIRHNLRNKVEASPMMDQARFARNMEEAYRGMWKKWCLGALE